MVAKIIATAVKMLKKTDPEQITTNAIAARAGVSKGSVYQYFANKEELIHAAIEQLAAEQAPLIEDMLRSVTMEQPQEAMQASIDILIDFTIANRKLIRYVADRPDYARTLENASGLNATLLALTTLHMAHYRDQYRHELSPRALAWWFFNMAVATTTRYIESDDPIQLDELRSGLKFASAGLLAAGRQ
ncbi:TetR/AcrR family transcriptional regulator [Mycolicibacterium fortuitum]|uniref:Helix-turn-helix domain-containing protein n=2 Tax=Mycolicibacterium fortuitum TaxID=1766 RepID=A0AAE5ADT7_MYCFO|nr:TetR/AcrR family transcriptional regulator [Mycolicibacterium fortuitum]MCV7142782.1 TetR/AcrR family transcriptional regulator [Mycolicibacterium fortuitum]MDV7192517.1 helix-turn-helix domain-containing protein [Mycolicibacterium fortuitum]MDV7205418.1 helix-turn-helix domain-containing protein [Mycolicibacterium fortuitum]MDV7226999.1 helix-turn-helix domain-containing protein [Mycolicibacterium fortuitum]MDV7259756.1 helix-turn-helix domain-containing protein [Mycolicibacterium fortuitu